MYIYIRINKLFVYLLKIIVMPYKSQKQRAYFHAHEQQLKKAGVNVKEWDKSSKGKKLPVQVKKKK